jgi:hypothetical protein
MIESKTNRVAEDPFFIGWLPMPPAYRRFVAPVTLVLLLAAAGIAATVTCMQRDPGRGRWDSDVVTLEGRVYTRPYALLRVPGGTLLLVEAGKFGALARVAALGQGQAVRARGTLLERDGRWMLELAEGEEGLRRLTAEKEERLPLIDWPEPRLIDERITLKGEIIDPKCYLGAMKPGGGKTHKACAMLCISGGVPPMLVTRAVGGQETFYLLTTAEGGIANELVLPFVGDPVAVTGRLEQHGDLLVLRIAPQGIRRR